MIQESESAMITVFVRVAEKIHKCVISKKTHGKLRAASMILKRPAQWILARVVIEKKDLNEENILSWLRKHQES